MTANVKPVLLMVSGGSDSMALLELAALAASSQKPADPASCRLARAWEAAFGTGALHLECLHVNHMLRGEASDGDEAFVQAACENLGIPFHVRHVDIQAICEEDSSGMEAVARKQRYLAADQVLDECCAKLGVSYRQGMIATAHTLDDRVETYLMRTLVGTGPGGLGSIPRVRGRVRRPLLDMLREELRDFLRCRHPGLDDSCLWREDATNDDGSNFRGRVRRQLLPQMRQLVPGFERNLARTMDLIAEEDAALVSHVQGIVYRNLVVGAGEVSISAEVLKSCSTPIARRVLRQCLLTLCPQARLEARQIARVLEALGAGGMFATEVDSGIRVSSDGETLRMVKL